MGDGGREGGGQRSSPRDSSWAGHQGSPPVSLLITPPPHHPSPSPLRFALDLTHHPWLRGDAASTAERTLATAEAADGGGIDAIWVSEDPEGWDAFGLLGALAVRTRRARLGTGVTTPFLRHPNLLAASVATLDRLSGGRAVLGIGRGQSEWYRHGLGIDTPDPLAALEETFGLLRAWWADGRASSPSGGAFAVADWERQVGPLGAPPILLAAAGPKALALAGRLADGVVFNAYTSDAFLAEAIPLARSAAAAAGRDPAALWFVLRTPATVTADPAVALSRARATIALVNGLPGMGRLIHEPGFDTEAVVAEVRRRLGTEGHLAAGRGFPDLRRGDLDGAKAAIPEALAARLAIAGDLGHVRARLAAVATLGVTHVSVFPPEEATAEGWSALLGGLRKVGDPTPGSASG